MTALYNDDEAAAAGPAHVEFTYTPSELREATKAGRRHQGKGRHGGVWGWWVLWIGALAFAAAWWVDPPAAFQERQHARPTFAVRAFAAALPLAFVGFVSVTTVLTSGRLTQRGRSLVSTPMTLSVGADGISSDHAGTSGRYSWPNLDRFVETDRLFMLRVVHRQGWLVVPKRAVLDPVALANLRQTMAAGVSHRTNAFPVLPPATPPG